MPTFSPPARIDDFTMSAKAAELAEGWSAIVDYWLSRAATRADGLFYDAQTPGAPSGGAAAPITWDAFPLVLRSWFDGEPGGDGLAYRAADTLKPLLGGGRKLRAVREDDALGEELDLAYRQQDEYCEWFVERDGDRVTGMQFTSEGPEYWEFLVSGTRPFFPEGDQRAAITSGDPDLALALYRQHISSEVSAEDLVWQHRVAFFDAGRQRWVLYAAEGDYNPLNRWNTERGAMHLTHPSNTLQAEVSLAADATVLRDVPSDAEELVCCAGYGDANRSSDPLIGLGVNRVAAQNQLVTLADPIGLYIASVNTGALSDPGSWSAARGSAEGEAILRARIDVPSGGDLEVGGVPLRYGGQVADHIQMILTGLANPHDGALPAKRGCEVKCCKHPQRPAFKSLVGLADDCADVSWEARGPYVAAVEPALAAAEAPPPLAGDLDLTPFPAAKYRPVRR
jgi:hypothetical protein